MPVCKDVARPALPNTRRSPHAPATQKKAFSKLLEALAIQHTTWYIMHACCLMSAFLAEIVHRGHVIGAQDLTLEPQERKYASTTPSAEKGDEFK